MEDHEPLLPVIYSLAILADILVTLPRKIAIFSIVYIFFMGKSIPQIFYSILKAKSLGNYDVSAKTHSQASTGYHSKPLVLYFVGCRIAC